jgi:hypothetical protein
MTVRFHPSLFTLPSSVHFERCKINRCNKPRQRSVAGQSIRS